LNGSQNHAFEELCCQLAEYETVPGGSRFVRKGAPDAGVECLWTLPNGDEWGWQAKFFVSSLSDGEWAQLDESVQTALEKHPRLTKYFVCVPVNFPDARLENKKSALEKWKEHVTKWEGWAAGRSMKVEFVHWGDSALISRLSKDEHRGRRFFWFNEEVFPSAWFANQISEATANAGPRYTPELNVDLPIARNFDGLGRTAGFYSRIAKAYGELRRCNAHCYPRTFPEPGVEKLFLGLQSSMTELLRRLHGIKEPTSEAIPFDSVISQLTVCGDRAYECLKSLEKDVQREAKEAESASKTGEYRKELTEYRHDLGQLTSLLRKMGDIVGGTEANLANLPALLLVGSVGIGKTHLLCDVAQRRLSEDAPTILVLGEQFIVEEPWAQTIKLVGMKCSRDEFLGALDAAGGASRARALIFIDALNEGEGNQFWSKYLAGILTTLSRYKHIGLAISVRSSYESTIVPAGLVPKKLIRVVHEGFSDSEYVAMRTFFDYFGIQHPSVPLLAPEFQNPLFLKIFCQSLKNLGLTRIPVGLTGITKLLSFFLDSVNTKLSQPDRLDFDPNDRPVSTAVKKLTEMMAKSGKKEVDYGEAQMAVNAVLPRDGFERSLFKNLISEGVLARERVFVGALDKYNEVIRFSYERFTDHLVVGSILDGSLDPKNPSAAFTPDSRLEELFKDEINCSINRGLLEALCVQIPERIGKEVPDLLAHCRSFRPMRLAFVESLIWRNTAAFSEATLAYVNSEVLRYTESGDQFLDALLTVATYPEHPYNSRQLLHSHLLKFGMAERDSWWSIFLHKHYDEGGAISRLIDWAWFSQDKSHVSDDSVLLAAIALAWFLTSSNRYLRDRSTKALVSLLSTRIQILRKLLRGFRDVNDLYVAERIYAVAYGCALRATDTLGVADLARDVYEMVFASGKPIPHVLLRDYARGVIEVALHTNPKLRIKNRKFRPPYKSTWPGRIPSLKRVEKEYGTWHKGMPDDQIARLTILHSVLGGDFGRYIIGTNFGRREFSSNRLGKPKKLNYKERYARFIRSLTKRQRAAVAAYKEDLRTHALRSIRNLTSGIPDSSSSAVQRTPKTAEPSTRSLRSALGVRKYRGFRTEALPYVKNPRIDAEREYFDLGIAQRWVLKRVLELGWTVERFGYFDRNTDRWANTGRSEHKAERIGKKYQWIAYHEFLALMLDNFEFRADSWGEKPEKYEGTWQLSVRDIDPSVVITKTKAQRRTSWWATPQYEDWRTNPDDKSWIADASDLPDPKSLLIVTDPKDGSRWITLEGWYVWEEPYPPEEERFEKERREIWDLVRCYLVRKQDSEMVFAWARTQDFMGRWMPENSDLWKIFLGEFPWAPAFGFYDIPYYGHEAWTTGSRKELPASVHCCAEGYLGESTTRDCSVEDTLNIGLPSKFILDGMRLRWNGEEGHFFDDSGRVIAFDPSVKGEGPSVLLIREEDFLNFLEKADCDFFWMLLGEKQMMGGHMLREEWKGRLEVSGAFRKSKSGVEGQMNTKHESGK